MLTDHLQEGLDGALLDIVTPEGQRLVAPDCLTDEEWTAWFWQVIRKYPGHRAVLIYAHS